MHADALLAVVLILLFPLLYNLYSKIELHILPKIKSKEQVNMKSRIIKSIPAHLLRLLTSVIFVMFLHPISMNKFILDLLVNLNIFVFALWGILDILGMIFIIVVYFFREESLK